MKLLLQLFPCLLMCTLAKSQKIFVTDMEMQRNNTDFGQSLSNETELLYEEYFPLLITLVNLPKNETDALEKYLNQRTYAELKRMIDSKTNEINIRELSSRVEISNLTDLSRFVSIKDNKKFFDIIEAYHNASIYALIRGIWNSQLHSILPPIDQLALLEYFEEQNSERLSNLSFFERVWDAIQRLFARQKDISCAADRPECIRRLVDRMEKEERAEIERAADNDDVLTVEGKIREEINRLPEEGREEFAEWRAENYPPVVLLNIIYDASELENDALDRLRKHGLIHSLKDYYRAMIELKTPEEQEEIRQFFHRMNDTFARCYNPLKTKYKSSYEF